VKIDQLKFDANGLLTAVVQDHVSGRILMVGYANREAVQKTLDTKTAWFYSRSRQSLWNKGETSGNTLNLKGLRVDCDGDALIYLAEPVGPTCHTGEQSCFFDTLEDFDRGETSGEAAEELFGTIRERAQASNTSGSYVAKLLSEGVDRVAKKVGEEATEVVIAAKNADPVELSYEMADLWFHSYLLLAQQSMTPEHVWARLRERRKPAK
jgi:phosphoribosyl-ATP pyrophosphohydrolase/phosphoribosyl-AMP cyclohydrolase